MGKISAFVPRFRRYGSILVEVEILRFSPQRRKGRKEFMSVFLCVLRVFAVNEVVQNVIFNHYIIIFEPPDRDSARRSAFWGDWNSPSSTLYFLNSSVDPMASRESLVVREGSFPSAAPGDDYNASICAL